jgi:hypothetical protein
MVSTDVQARHRAHDLARSRGAIHLAYRRARRQKYAYPSFLLDDFQAQRSPDGRYRTTPLKGLFTRTKGGFYHDGRFADSAAVIDHYDGFLRLGLEGREKADLQEFLKSLQGAVPSSFHFFPQLLEQSLDTKIGSRELVHEDVLCRRPLRGAGQQLVDSSDLRNQFRSVHRAFQSMRDGWTRA